MTGTSDIDRTRFRQAQVLQILVAVVAATLIAAGSSGAWGEGPENPCAAKCPQIPDDR